MEIPGEYTEGYARGRATDPERAANYVAHTTVGDPLADAMVVDLDALGPEESSRLIRLGMHGDDENALRDAPATVREFFESIAEPPDWVDLPSFLPGCRMFHRNTRLVLAAMVGGVLVEGFSTNIARSFFLTGKLRDQGIRRLKQNNRHMLEIFMPWGMERHNDGWTHSVRVRLVHARIRQLIANSNEWNIGELGTPISAAHVGFAVAAFSARCLQHLEKLGAKFNAEERRSFMAVWRYSGYLMGIPESILYRDEAEALEVYRIGLVCEPPPSLESVVLASSLINSAPLFAGLTERQARRKLAGYITEVSRALIGNEMADLLKYPESDARGVLWRFRVLNRVEKLMNLLSQDRSRKNVNLTTILDVSMFDNEGISYKLPDHVHAEESSQY